LALFHATSLVSPVANLIAIPWISVTVVPLTLLAVLAGFVNEAAQAGVLETAAFTMEWLWRFLSALSRQPWALASLPAPPVWVLLVAMPGVALLFAPTGVPARWLGGVIVMPIVFFAPVTLAPGTISFTMLDVGPGLAVVVRTARHVLVYDTGPRLGASFDAGRAALVPFLRQDGIAEIDTLIVSHADNAHTGGARSLREQVAVKRVLTASPDQVPIEGARSCRAGMTWIWDEVRFEILHPTGAADFAGDDASCVLLVEAAGTRILLPGDIGPEAQAALVASANDSLAADILVAPYQGNRDLSSADFVAAVRPDYVLYSSKSGRKSSPAATPETLRHHNHAARVLDTVREGAISIRLEPGKPVVPEAYRENRRRRWHAR
jgi:competence protein ComEC